MSTNYRLSTVIMSGIWIFGGSKKGEIIIEFFHSMYTKKSKFLFIWF